MYLIMEGGVEGELVSKERPTICRRLRLFIQMGQREGKGLLRNHPSRKKEPETAGQKDGREAREPQRFHGQRK